MMKWKLIFIMNNITNQNYKRDGVLFENERFHFAKLFPFHTIEGI